MNSDFSGQREYRVGEWVDPGVYQDVDTRRIVRLEQEDTLPPSFDGRIAHYVRVEPWGTRLTPRHFFWKQAGDPEPAPGVVKNL